MNKLAENIRSQLKMLKMTQKALGDKAGVSQVTIHKLLSGKTNSTAKIVELANALECEPQWLLHGSGTPKEPNYTYSSVFKVPLLKWDQVSVFFENNFKATENKTILIPCISDNPNRKVFALEVKGDSMESPTEPRSYPAGTIVFIDPEQKITPGKKVIAQTEKGVTFKQFMEDENGKNYLKPLNPQHSLTPITDSDTLYGVIFGSYMPE